MLAGRGIDVLIDWRNEMAQIKAMTTLRQREWWKDKANELRYYTVTALLRAIAEGEVVLAVVEKETAGTNFVEINIDDVLAQVAEMEHWLTGCCEAVCDCGAYLPDPDLHEERCQYRLDIEGRE
jgi:hypothetical protein